MALIFRCQGAHKQRQQRQEKDGGNFKKGHGREAVGTAGDRSLPPLIEVWAPLPVKAPLPVPLAKPSHRAALCAGLHGWHLSRHRCNGRPYKQEDETRTGA
jgi:hypothetical protein